MPTSKHRIAITVDDSTADLFSYLSATTQLTESGIVSRILASHIEELWELREKLNKHPVGSKERALLVNSLRNYTRA